MSDNDFIIIDEEKETPVTTEGKESSDTEKKEVFQTSTKEEHEDEYEKICFICHRPESVTGKMICLLYTSPSPRDAHESRMPSSA